jgi:hypothetical protein
MPPGGVWTVAAFGLRIANRAQKEVSKAVGMEKKDMSSALPVSNNSDVAGSGSWMGGDRTSGNDWKRR